VTWQDEGRRRVLVQLGDTLRPLLQAPQHVRDEGLAVNLQLQIQVGRRPVGRLEVEPDQQDLARRILDAFLVAESIQQLQEPHRRL
jgi:hypothetical protein